MALHQKARQQMALHQKPLHQKDQKVLHQKALHQKAFQDRRALQNKEDDNKICGLYYQCGYQRQRGLPQDRQALLWQ